MDRGTGWALVQIDSKKWMSHLVALHNSFADNPACDFIAFRAAVDHIVRDELSKRKNDDTPVCALSPFIFDVFRRVWLSTKPFQLPSSFPHDGPVKVMRAPFLVIKDFEDQVRDSDDPTVGLDALYDYVQDNLEYNLECEYHLEELIRPGPTTADGSELSYDDMLRHHAQFREATQLTRTRTKNSSPTAEVAPVPIAAGFRAVQELHDHLGDRYQLKFDDMWSGPAEILKKLLEMNPDAVRLIKTSLDRIVNADPEYLGEKGCLVCIVITDKYSDVMGTQSDALERAFDESCDHMTAHCLFSFSLRRC